MIPCFYVKIVPIANWKISVNFFTICNIKLLGDTNQKLLQTARTNFAKVTRRIFLFFVSDLFSLFSCATEKQQDYACDS